MLIAGQQPDRRRWTWRGPSEVRRLLGGNSMTRDLLGLLAVSRGTLTGADLHALTDADPGWTEHTLHAVCGRRRPRDVGDRNTPPVGYRLSRSSLGDTIVETLGPSLADDYRQRLHAWADSYRIPVPGLRPAWPAETPAYLLTDYPQLLLVVDDLDRLTTLATDGCRQARILQMTDGRDLALAEIGLCQSRHLARAEPDLAALALLSYRRHRLEPCGRPDHDEESAVADLAGVLAEAGEPDRAVAVARRVTRRSERTRALATLAAAIDDRDWASHLAAEIEAALDAAAAPSESDAVPVLTDAAETEIRARPDVAPDLEERLPAFAERLRRQAREAAHDRYRRIARESAQEQTAMRADLVKAVAAAGEHRRALRLAALITDEQILARALLSLIQADIDGGRAKPRRRAINQVRTVIMRMSHPGFSLLSAAVQTLARAGEHELATALTAREKQLSRREELRGELARVIAQAGDIDRAERTVAEVGAGARPDPRNVVVLVQAAAEAGQYARAERIARDLPRVAARVWALSELATVAARAGDHSRVRRLTDDADHLTRRIVIDRQDRALAMTKLAGMVALAGDLPRAERIARRVRTVFDPVHGFDGRAVMLAALAGIAAQAREPVRARRLAEEALRRARGSCSCGCGGLHRQQLLIELARSAGEPHGRRFLAQVYAHGCWATPLPAVAAGDPLVLRRLAEAILTDREPSPV